MKPEKLKSINGVSIVWIEECSEVKYEGFKEIIGRLRHPTMSNHIILSSNPVSKSNWYYKHFFMDKKAKHYVLDDEELYKKKVIRTQNTYYHFSTVDDNYYVPQSYVDQLDELKEYDPDLYRIARQGRFGVNGTRVFHNIEIVPYDEGIQMMKRVINPIKKAGMDFGFVTSYNALVRLLIDHDKKDLYIYYEYYTRGKTDEQIAADIDEFKTTQETIKADCAEPKAIAYYKQKGFRMRPCRKFQGSREVYTKKVQRFRHIYILDNCTNCIEELKDLTFKENKNGELIEDEFEIDPHTLSAIWYALDDYEVTDLKKTGGISVLKF